MPVPPAVRTAPTSIRFGPLLAVDAVLVLVFAAIGRSSHDEGMTLAGVLATAWPFLCGGAVGWLLVALLRRRLAVSLGDGVVVWVATIVVGMALRRVVGDGTAAAFIVVATLTLGLFLLGPRALLARLLMSRSSSGRP